MNKTIFFKDGLSELIVERLKVLDPYLISVFGSIAKGTETKDSDIDLLIVLNKNEMPTSYEQKLEDKILVRDKIIDISMEQAIDLLVYYKKEYSKLLEIKNPFIMEIQKTGKVLYERAK